MERPRLLDLCDRASGRRLLLVVAEAGFGKTTLVRRWTRDRPTAWYVVTERDRALGAFAAGLVGAVGERWPVVGGARPGGTPVADPDEPGGDRALAVATAVGAALRTAAPGVLVLDDVHLLGAARGSWQLVEALLGALPEHVTLVLAGRADPPFRVDRLRGQGGVVDVTAGDLALTRAEVRALLAEELPGSAELADPLADAADGWPAATRLAVERLRHEPPARRPATLRALAHHGVVLDYLAAEVVEREPESERRLLAAVTPLPWFTAAMCRDLGTADPSTVATLLRRGVLVERAGHAVPDALEPVAPVRALVAARADPGPADREATVRRAAAWYAARGHLDTALDALAGLRDPGPAWTLLLVHGPALVAGGGAHHLLEVLERLDPVGRPRGLDAVEGEARLVVGHWEAALTCYRRVLADGPSRPDVAWRMAMMHYLRGDLDAALAVCEPVGVTEPGPGADPGELADRARVAAWHATALWVRGDLDRSRPLADRALALADRAGSDAARATAHTVLAMHAAVGDDPTASAVHSDEALRAATRAGDFLQQVRIRVNRASHVADEGDYERALADLDPALAMAELAGFANFHALGLSNRGEVLRALGRLDEAVRDLEEAVRRYRALGSRALSYPLGHLADVLRLRGERTLAVASYREALDLARRGGDRQGLGPAGEGLARALLGTDPAGAAAAAGEEPGPLLRALLAAARGDRPAARAAAVEHLASASARGRRPELAEALWLAGACGADLQQVEEAAALHAAMGDPLGLARCDLTRARLAGTDDRDAVARLRAAGAAGVLAEADLVVPPEHGPQPVAAVRIESLGQFRVVRGREPVPASAWQSRKARDLLKILVARRGAPVTRDEATELLWPGTEQRRGRQRLSVALRTVRAVLDPEGAARFDHFLAGDTRAVWLALERVDVDLVTFHEAADAGRLADAVATYGGDFCPEDLYEDWAHEPRAVARTRFLDALRGLARAARARGDRETAVTHLFRSVTVEPYDEASTVDLVGLLTELGRHGDARRVYRDYAARMFELGVEAVPFPA